MKRKQTQKMVLLANLLAIGIVLNIIESLYIHISPVPGAKIGFANIVTLIVIYLYGPKEAFILTLLRIFLVSVLIGTFLGPTFYLGLGGALMSITAMIILSKLNFFGIIGVSVLGSVFHAVGQVLIGIPVLGSSAIVYWLPVMLLISVPAGFLTGAISTKFLGVWRATHNEHN
ncbi:Gx transporter family protein [Mycoplasmatota bacterium]|nr:Gx transporter family protein [Mycoplasmatota bacterium]